jgi:hypothetical protein
MGAALAAAGAFLPTCNSAMVAARVAEGPLSQSGKELLAARASRLRYIATAA